MDRRTVLKTIGATAALSFCGGHVLANEDEVVAFDGTYHIYREPHELRFINNLEIHFKSGQSKLINDAGFILSDRIKNEYDHIYHVKPNFIESSFAKSVPEIYNLSYLCFNSGKIVEKERIISTMNVIYCEGKFQCLKNPN